MEKTPLAKPPCYVFDTSSLIEVEGSDGKGLKNMYDVPGKWFVVPSKVGKELNIEGAPADTKNWLKSGKTSTFSVDSEGVLFMKIRVQEKLLSDADIEGIVIAFHRKGTYVVEEGPATGVAQSLGVRAIKAAQFLREIKPFLPGFQ